MRALKLLVAALVLAAGAWLAWHVHSALDDCDVAGDHSRARTAACLER